MPDRETVMSWLEGLAQDDWQMFHSDSEVQEIAKTTLAILWEQEPVKPELRMSKHGFKQWIVCGNCYGKIYGGDDYCRHCGRKIKWNNKENENGF